MRHALASRWWLTLVALMVVGVMSCARKAPPPAPVVTEPQLAEEEARRRAEEEARRRREARERALSEARTACSSTVTSAGLPGSFADELWGQVNSQFFGGESLPDLNNVKSFCDGKARTRVVEVVAERVHFDFDKADLKPEFIDVLNRKAQVLKANRDLKAEIQGHCDERGTNKYNLALGERRARAAFEYLVTAGISADQLSTISYGEERPLVPEHEEEAWAQNRRAEFVVQNP